MVRQSPIDITGAVSGTFSTPLSVSFTTKSGPRSRNTGHCLHVDTVGHVEGVMSGGPLAEQYELQQFHFHWGDAADKGSEHTIEGKAWSAELHFVFKNSKYDTMGDAVQEGDGLAVCGVMLQETEEGQEGVMPELFGNIPQGNGEEHQMPDTLDLSSALPSDMSYFTYLGSLTTPTYNECVTWIVLQNEVKLSNATLADLRNMSSGEGDGKILNNWREVQDLAGRKITSVKA